MSNVTVTESHTCCIIYSLEKKYGRLQPADLIQDLQDVLAVHKVIQAQITQSFN